MKIHTLLTGARCALLMQYILHSMYGRGRENKDTERDKKTIWHFLFVVVVSFIFAFICAKKTETWPRFYKEWIFLSSAKSLSGG